MANLPLADLEQRVARIERILAAASAETEQQDAATPNEIAVAPHGRTPVTTGDAGVFTRHLNQQNAAFYARHKP